MKFTQLTSQKQKTLFMNRLVYMAETAEEIATKATTEMAEAAEKVENQVKLDQMDPYKALKEAKEKIFVKWQVASERVAPTPSMKYKAEIIKLLDKLNKAKSDANKKLDDNMNHYLEVAAFLKKRTELELMIEKNKTSMGTVEAQLLFVGVEALTNAIAAFETESKALESMPDIGLEKEKMELKTKVDGQKKDMEKLKAKLIAYHSDKIKMADESLNAIKNIMSPEYIGPKVLSDRTIQDLYAHLYYLDGLMVNASAGLEEAGLTEEVNSRRKDFEKTLAEAEKQSSIDSTLKVDQKPQWEAYKKSRDNFFRAKANLEAVISNPKSTQAEKRKAESWYAGAQQTASEQLEELKKRYVSFRENEENIKAFERDKKDIDNGVDLSNSFYTSESMKQMRPMWDEYDRLKAEVASAKEEVDSTAPKGKASKENQQAEVKLFHAQKQLAEKEAAIRKEYNGFGPNDVSQDLYEERFYDGTLRIGTTTVEHVEPKKKEETPPEQKPEKKIRPDLPVASKSKSSKDKRV